MLTFYPGPSKVYPQVKQYLSDAYDSGILSINHRSSEFMQLCQQTTQLLHQKLNIPADYTILFVSSATECWEIVTQSFMGSQTSAFHFYNGAFGQKWYDFANQLNHRCRASIFDLNNQLGFHQIRPTTTGHLFCFTQNETSNGTQVREDVFRDIAKPGNLVAVDATSSLGGITLDFLQADIWFASVQKCLGLPAGMGLLIVSPQGADIARHVNDREHYNSFPLMEENMIKNQTHYTPNVLSIYLLMRLMQDLENVTEISQRIRSQATEWYQYLGQHTSLKPLVSNPWVRSDTVIAVTGQKSAITDIHQQAEKAGITLGRGYGNWKDTTFRIANFPAITADEHTQLRTFLSEM